MVKFDRRACDAKESREVSVGLLVCGCEDGWVKVGLKDENSGVWEIW